MSNQSWSCRNILFFFLASSNWKVVPLRPNVSTCKGLQTVRHRGITNAALQRGGRYRKSAGHRMKRQTRWHRCPPNVGARREGKKRELWGIMGHGWFDGATKGQTHTRKTRCFLALGSDGRHPPTNKSEPVKQQDAEKGIQSDAGPSLWAESGETCSECESRCSHIEEESWACPNLARLMKNGQESAYFACPSFHSNAATLHFLLLFTTRPSPRLIQTLLILLALTV